MLSSLSGGMFIIFGNYKLFDSTVFGLDLEGREITVNEKKAYCVRNRLNFLQYVLKGLKG